MIDCSLFDHILLYYRHHVPTSTDEFQQLAVISQLNTSYHTLVEEIAQKHIKTNFGCDCFETSWSQHFSWLYLLELYMICPITKQQFNRLQNIAKLNTYCDQHIECIAQQHMNNNRLVAGHKFSDKNPWQKTRKSIQVLRALVLNRNICQCCSQPIMIDSSSMNIIGCCHHCQNVPLYCDHCMLEHEARIYDDDRNCMHCGSLACNDCVGKPCACQDKSDYNPNPLGSSIGVVQYYCHKNDNK